EAAELVERVPVRSCRRRGGAIDLVLDRPREHRSQLVFTRVRGRQVIFWQSPRTARGARPGGRVPGGRAGGRRGGAGPAARGRPPPWSTPASATRGDSAASAGCRWNGGPCRPATTPSRRP